MGTFPVNNYGASSPTSNSSSSSSSTSTAKIDTTEFMQLLAKQLSCQDPLNPTDDTQFITQMAQMTTLQNSEDMYNNSTQQLDAIQSLMMLSTMQYGATLVGKSVHVSTQDDKGNTQNQQGIVSSVNFSDDTFTLTIDGKEYPITSVTQVSSAS